MSRVERLSDGVTLYLGDCQEILPSLGRFDACVTDPPYGIGMDGGNVGYKGFNNFTKLDWDKAPPSPALIAMILASADKHIIWGGNYFALPPSRCFLVWDKGAGFKGRSYAECELAWASFDANARIFEHDPLARGDYKNKAHPTQKPIELMKWCLGFVKGRIIDPFMGSGSTGCAAAKMGMSFTGIEKQPAYFDAACKRIQAAIDAPDLFLAKPKKTEVQEVMPL